MQSFIDVHITIPVNATELAGLISDKGMLGVWEQDGVIHVYWESETWNERVLTSLQEAIQQLGMHCGQDCLAVRKIPSQNWNAKWTEMVQPIQIGQRIVVRPSWARVDIPSNGIELILDPQQAFGTGHHITTQLLGEWLEECIKGGERVLDVGTGSGLLAMIALRLGAKYALGIDHDGVAIECAKEYAKLNQFADELDLRTADMKNMSDDSFDLILANIDRRTLLAHHQQLNNVSSKHTVLLIAGILETDRNEIIERYTKSGWRCVKHRMHDDWVAIQFQSDLRCISQVDVRGSQ